MSTYNPFKVNSSNNNTNPFLSIQSKFSSNISTNNPFLPQNNQSFSNISNQFTKMNSVNNNNNKFPSQNSTNPFLSSSNNNNSFLNNNNSTFNSINNNTNFLSNNNNTNTSNPFLSTNTTVNNPFLKSSNQNNISNNPFTTTNLNSGFLNNNQNFSSTNSNPFTSTLNSNNSNNNNNYNPFLSNRGNNNNIFNSYSGNSSINFNQNNNNNNNIFNSTNNFGNSGSTISFGFNNNNSNNNFIVNNNSQNINNNNFFINSQQYTPIFSSEQNNKSFSQGNNNNNTSNEKNNKNPSKKSIPLSKILSLRFQSEDFLEEVLTKLNEDSENAKILSKSLNLNNYNDFIIETILSSKSKKDEYINKEEDSTHNILNERNMEIKRRRERILNEERYQRHLKNLYRKSEKDDLKRIIQLNSQKQSINNFVYNSEQKKRKMNLNEIQNNDSDKNKNKNERDIRKINNNKNIVYKIFIKVINDKIENILEKNIVVDKKQNYILDLDKLYIDITYTLKILNVKCRYGLNYKINDFEIEKNIRKINLLEYDAQGSIKTENDYYKELRMEISIINEENISEEKALLNLQLHCKNDKNYKLNPSLDIINNSNLFQYNKGLEIIFENISIIFSNKELYDFTSINFDELCYDGNYDIFFDESKYKKDKSTFKKLWDKNVCLIFKQLDSENEIFAEFLEKRYSAEFFEEKEGKIVIITKLKNLFLTDKERKGFSLNNK